WRVDQILTSYLFDLETTRDMYFSAQEKEYQQLLDLQAGGRLNKTNKERLAELKKWLKEHKSSPGETVEENDLFDAANILSDLLDNYLAEGQK
ncbi:MAG: hypothetical protein GY797_13150, partial [Deltaproteobacteria bacterium]|nr:hypothetical protein [Deltaproteobacteria bacterium]